MIDAATDAQAAGLARPAERLRQAPHLNLAQHSHEPLATSNRPARLHVRGNGLGDMKVAASLDFFHFQQIGWK